MSYDKKRQAGQTWQQARQGEPDVIPDDDEEELSPEKQVAEFNAQKAAEKALEKDQEALDAAERATELAEEAEDADQPKARRCPHCGERMIKHTNPANEHTFGAWHCNNCGGCWRGMKIREGHAAPAGFTH